MNKRDMARHFCALVQTRVNDTLKYIGLSVCITMPRKKGPLYSAAGFCHADVSVGGLSDDYFTKEEQRTHLSFVEHEARSNMVASHALSVVQRVLQLYKRQNEYERTEIRQGLRLAEAALGKTVARL